MIAPATAVAGHLPRHGISSAHAAGDASHGRSISSGPDSQEQAVVRQLAARDREVRAHEQAHAAAAAGIPHSAPSYSTVKGPDGRLYAVGGSVSIDTSPVAGDPQATLEKAERIQRAALAPAQPSSQDRAVAARAAAMAVQARAELQAEGGCPHCGGSHGPEVSHEQGTAPFGSMQAYEASAEKAGAAGPGVALSISA